MPDSYYNQDDPTQPVQPRQPYQEPGQQGKLVLGGFQNPPNQPGQPRQPYQYPPQGPTNRPPNQGQQPPQYNPRGNEARQQVPPPMSPPPAQPGSNRYAPPQQGYGQVPYTGGPRRKRRRGGCAPGCIVVLVILAALGVLTFTTTQRALAFGSAVSTQQPLSTQTNYMNTSERTNLLVLGYGGAGHDGSLLTDSLLVVSLMPQNHHTSLISVPRDLWVQVPEGSGQYGKINSVYEVGSNFGKNQVAGGDAAAKKLSLVTGMNVKYWMTINFQGFREFIDAIGGVDVYVPNSFNACYPKNDNAAKDASWIKVQFNKGMQHMDGATAITYARAREPLSVCGMGTSQNLAELTDFGRSARQQIIVKAALAKMKQVSTWPKFFDATTALQHAIYTNMSLTDLGLFAQKMDLNDTHTAHIGLSNANVLQDDANFNLHPLNNNWQNVTDYVQKHLYN
jgi:LCP family protein required for cell wall assembly